MPKASRAKISLARITAGLLGIITVGWFSATHPPDVRLAEVLAHPQLFAGKTVILYVETTADSVTSEGFRLRQGIHTVWVAGHVENLSPGDFVSLDGVFKPSGEIQLGSIYIAKYRRLKMIVSIVGAGFVGMLLTGRLRLRDGQIEGRDDA